MRRLRCSGCAAWTCRPSRSAAWAGIVYSALFSLVAAYVIWYTAVREVGGGHTAMYSNIVPLVAMAVAAVVVHEPLTALKIGGASAVLVGVALTRLDVGGSANKARRSTRVARCTKA